MGSPFFGRTQSSPFLKKLEAVARTLDNRVRFTGFIRNESLPDYYRLADLVCVPTLVQEAAGLVAIEAMAAAARYWPPAAAACRNIWMAARQCWWT